MAKIELTYSGPVPTRPADYYALTDGAGHSTGYVYTLWRGVESRAINELRPTYNKAGVN